MISIGIEYIYVLIVILTEYDHEAFLGNEKAAFDELSGEEAKARLKKLIPRVDENGDE